MAIRHLCFRNVGDLEGFLFFAYGVVIFISWIIFMPWWELWEYRQWLFHPVHRWTRIGFLRTTWVFGAGILVLGPFILLFLVCFNFVFTLRRLIR
jgi:hypothetical protein